MDGMIVDIQSYALYDGPGIRTCVYFKGCPLRCRWCHNPESIAIDPQMAFDGDRCQACGACVELCPQGAITFASAAEILRDPDRCVACGRCSRRCPHRAVERIGRRVAAGEVATIVGRDRAFFDESGGGATISGGEPTRQRTFLFELLGHLRRAEIHTAVETCGYFAAAIAAPLADATDLILFDIKHIDPLRHRQGTGADNRLILANFSRILKRMGPDRLLPRIPIIPGFNDDPEDVAASADFLRGLDYRGPVHLMAHHGWAKEKYKRLGRGGDFFDGGPITTGVQSRIEAQFKTRGLEPLWRNEGMGS